MKEVGKNNRVRIAVKDAIHEVSARGDAYHSMAKKEEELKRGNKSSALTGKVVERTS